MSDYLPWLEQNLEQIVKLAELADPVAGWSLLASDAIYQMLADIAAGPNGNAGPADQAIDVSNQLIALVNAGKLTGEQAIGFLDAQSRLARAQDKSFINEVGGVIERAGEALEKAGKGAGDAGRGVGWGAGGLALLLGGGWWVYNSLKGGK